MTLTRWQIPQHWTLSPFRRVANLRDEVDQLFQFAFGRAGSPLPNGWAPAVDLYEDKDTVTVQAELPGLKKEDINISLEDGFLTISGERKQEQKAEGAESYRTERFVGIFQRTVSLPSEVDAEKIKASYTDGILTVTLPKSEKSKPKQIPISVE
jgi:HSP20 family protein